MCKATDSSPPQLEGWQAIALIDSLRDTIASLFGAAREMNRVAAGQSTQSAALSEHYRSVAEQAKAQLAALEAGQAASPVSEKDWYCDVCGHSNVVHEAEVQWNPRWGCMEIANMVGDRHCVECMQEQTFPENRGNPVFGVKPEVVRPAA